MKVQVFILLSVAICGFVKADADHPHGHAHPHQGPALAQPASVDYSVPASAGYAAPVADYSVPTADYSVPAPVADYSVPEPKYAAPAHVAPAYQVPAYEFYPQPSKSNKMVDFYNKKISKMDAVQGKFANKFFNKFATKSKYPTHSYSVPQVSYDDGTGASYGHDAVKYVFIPVSFAKNNDYKGNKGYVNDYSGGYGDVNVKEGYGTAGEPVPTKYVYMPLSYAKNKDYEGKKGYVRNYDVGASDVEVIHDDYQPEPIYGAPAPVYGAPQPADSYGAPEPIYSAPAPQPAYGATAVHAKPAHHRRRRSLKAEITKLLSLIG